MAIVYRITNRLEMVTGIPADASVNVHHVISQADGPMTLSQMTEVAAKFVTFYTAIAPVVLSNAIRRGSPVHSVTVARLDTNSTGASDDVLTPPLLRTDYQIAGASTGASLPAECAIAVSHRGLIDGVPEETGSTRPRSRRRGRFYLGPLTNNSGTEDATTKVLSISDFARTAILNAFETMCEALAAESDPGEAVSYGVYSPTSDSFFSVETAHIDNAYDTIRRRGVQATARSIRDISLVVDHIGNVSEVGV